MALKLEAGFVDNFSLMVEGNQLVISYRGHELERKNLKHIAIVYKDLKVYLGERSSAEKSLEVEGTDGEQAITHSDVLRFAQVYTGLMRKYTGREVTYKAPEKGAKPSTRNNWAALERATAQAMKNNIDFPDYLGALIAHYSRRANRGGGAGVSFPFPNQLAGEWAQQVLVEEAGRKNAKLIPPEIRAERLAGTNRYLHLEKDQAYLEAKERAEKGKHDRFDIEYMKARQTQVAGEPRDWLLKLERELNAKERQGVGDEEKG